MHPHHKAVLEDLQTLQLDEKEIPQKSPFLTIILPLAAILSILLMVSFIFVTFPIADILLGKAESQSLQGNTLALNQYQIIFENDTLTNLQSFYLQQQKVEWSACLEGTKESNIYHITHIYQPSMHQQSFNHVSFASCSSDTLIFVHTHPYKRCQASQTDRDTLQNIQQEHPDTLMLVMCEPTRFSAYS